MPDPSPDTPSEPEVKCEHTDFVAEVDVSRLTADEGGSVGAYMAEVRIWCNDCRERFRFIGLDVGYSPRNPATRPDHQEARLPIAPASAPADFGLGGPGFTMTSYLGQEN